MLKKGDKVRVARKIYGNIGWVSYNMDAALGKEGKIIDFYPNDGVKVSIKGIDSASNLFKGATQTIILFFGSYCFKT